MDGKEVSVWVLKYSDKIIVLWITEIISDKEFFDYDAKYNNASQEITPARLDQETQTKLEQIAIKVYNVLWLDGFSRSEYIIVDNTPYLLEINTNPWFSPNSILPQQAKHSNISIKSLCTNEINKVLN